MSTVRTFSTPQVLAREAAQVVVTLAREAIKERGRFSIALSGGSTPKALYERLARREVAAQIDWKAVHVFWGDERTVPPDHADSNYRMANEVWLKHVPIPAENVHRIQGEMAPAAAAADYEGMLRTFFGAKLKQGQALRAAFDLVLLGMGDDGHTASLFPNAAAIHESRHWVTAYRVDKLDTWRISLTPAALNAARQVVFLVTGADKAARLRQVLYGTYKPDLLPAQIIRPERGRLVWMVDDAAAGSAR